MTPPESDHGAGVDPAAGATVTVLEGHTYPVLGMAWSPDGTRLASASEDRTVRVWDSAAGKTASVLGLTDQTDKLSFGYLATWILNGAVRPLLADWHHRLEDWENRRPATVSRQDHERAWEQHNELRADIERTRLVLIDYAWLLSRACGAPALMVANSQISHP